MNFAARRGQRKRLRETVSRAHYGARNERWTVHSGTVLSLCLFGSTYSEQARPVQNLFVINRREARQKGIKTVLYSGFRARPC